MWMAAFLSNYPAFENVFSTCREVLLAQDAKPLKDICVNKSEFVAPDDSDAHNADEKLR